MAKSKSLEKIYHPIALQVLERSVDEYFGIKKIFYSDYCISGYLLDEYNVKQCDQCEDVSFYMCVDWNLDAKSAKDLLEVIHQRIRNNYYSLNRILWWDVNYWAFFKTLSLYAAMTGVNKRHLVTVIKKHELDRMLPFKNIQNVRNKSVIRKAIGLCLHSWCSPRRNVAGQLVVGNL